MQCSVSRLIKTSLSVKASIKELIGTMFGTDDGEIADGKVLDDHINNVTNDHDDRYYTKTQAAEKNGSTTETFAVADADDDTMALNLGQLKSYYFRGTLSDYVVLNDETLKLDTVISNDDSAYNTSTGEYTAPEDGVYTIHVPFLISDYGGNDDTIRIGFLVNGAQVFQHRVDYYDNHNGLFVETNDNIKMTAGDKLRVVIYIDGDDGVKIGRTDYSVVTIFRAGL